MYLSTIQMAWRNLWRNTRRTLITTLAIGLGLGAIIITLAWVGGLMEHLIQTMTGTNLGQAQIHAPGYRETREEELLISRAEEVLMRVDKTPGLVGAAPRLYAQGMAAMGDRSSGVEVMGVDFGREKKVTNWSDKLTSGTYPGGGNEVLIGQGLARKLELSAGAKLVLTVARVGSGDLESALVRIAGIINTGIPMLDDHSVIGSLEMVGKLNGLKGSVHQIALMFGSSGLEKDRLEKLIQPLQELGLDVQPWQVLAPMISGMLDLQGFYFGLAIAIIFGLVAFGIVNTMSMSLLERFKEFGVLRAIGTSPLRLFGLIITEAASLGVVGGAIGTVLGVGVTLIFNKIGINMGDVEAMGVTIDSIIYPHLDYRATVLVVLVFLILTPMVALGPALKAARIVPVRALRSE